MHRSDYSLCWADCRTMSRILVTGLFSWRDGRPWPYLRGLRLTEPGLPSFHALTLRQCPAGSAPPGLPWDWV